MLRERETGDVWEIIEYRRQLAVIKRQRDGLLRTIVVDNAHHDYESTTYQTTISETETTKDRATRI